MEPTVAAAPEPVPTMTNKEKNAARLAALKAKNEAKKVAGGADVGAVSDTPGTKAPSTKVRAAKAPAEPKPCKCGCGGRTKSFFIPGHDARFKGWLLKIERGEKQPGDFAGGFLVKSYEWKKRGKGQIPTTNYKGEPHAGYLKDDEVLPE